MPGRRAMSAHEEKEIFESVRTSAERIIHGKGVTNYAIGLAEAAILEAILWNEGRVLPVSSLLTEYRDISEVCLSIPSIVGRRGVEGLLPVPMNPEEEAGLRSSAETVQRVVRALGF